MVTKSKNDWAVVWSIIGIVIAALSIGYCFAHIIELVSNGMENSGRAIAQLTRLIKGGV
ncbi:MAG TPA: hypothetical protein K8V56_12935 [Sporosarcina psychrophila]|uniref:Uncharacterized protein n=1 Tax=Sporosarcina psychrophila TaxID=1476 RepID=A0A921G0Y4_SPOPS|nr:hypothetical protein [Sporosarcina psychrophila]